MKISKKEIKSFSTNPLVMLGINFVLMFLKTAIKNPASAEALKTNLLQIRDDINILWPEE